MLEVGTGQLLEIPCNFESFLNQELIDYQDAALASIFYDEWKKTGGTAPQFNQCIGYKIPPFLGGDDAVENLELVNLDVYLHITGELFRSIS